MSRSASFQAVAPLVVGIMYVTIDSKPSEHVQVVAAPRAAQALQCMHQDVRGFLASPL